MKTRSVVLLVGFAVLLAACGLANPWPTITIRTGTHHVLLVGDSLMVQTNDQLPAALAAKGFTGTTVASAAVNGTNLVDPVSGLDPVVWIEQQIDAHPEADTVVFEFVGTCGICTAPGTGAFADYGGVIFYNIWQTNAHAVIDYAKAHGKLVVWVTSPKIAGSTSEPASARWLSPSVANTLSWSDDHDFGPYAAHSSRWWDALNDTSGGYQEDLYYDGAQHSVRPSDDIHLTSDGSYRAAVWTVAAFGQAWAS